MFKEKQSHEEKAKKHPYQTMIKEYAIAIPVLLLSAFVYAFGYRAFIAPGTSSEGIPMIATGGMGGVSQIVVRIVQFIAGKELETKTFQSIFYAVLNIPVLILAWKSIGKRFAIFSIVNVVAVSLFIQFLPNSFVKVFADMGEDYLARALFGGICTGLSSALALMVDGSAGGMDIISYHIAIRKSTSIGKYIILFNGCIISIFTILNYFPALPNETKNPDVWRILLYSIIYLFSTSLVIDQINKRNKKAQIQIITTRDDLPKILMAAFHHSCTVVDAKGAFSGENKKIIYMVVSSFQVKEAIQVIREADPQSFVNVVAISQVYGKFFIKPIK